MLKPGCIPAIIYFEYRNGHVTLAPFTDCPTPEGSIRKEADTLSQADKLEARLQQQEREQLEREMEYEEALFEGRKQAIRDRMYARSISSATSAFEKELLQLYPLLKDEQKKAKYRQRLLEHQFYLYARHNNLGDRDASKEEVNLDKVNF
jgi:hypothetical protein